MRDLHLIGVAPWRGDLIQVYIGELIIWLGSPSHFNLLTAKLFNWNFYPLEVVSRWRDPQLQVSENYLDLTKWRSTVFKSCWLMI